MPHVHGELYRNDKADRIKTGTRSGRFSAGGTNVEVERMQLKLVGPNMKISDIIYSITLSKRKFRRLPQVTPTAI